MLFNSYAFLLIFLPVVLAVATCLRGQNLLRWITGASFVFYALAGHWWFLVPMTVTTVLDFFIGIQMERQPDARKRRRLLVVSLTGNLGLLMYFKYAGLFLRTGTAVVSLFRPGLAPPAWLSAVFAVVLPAGISFYTFQTLSYIMDVYRRQCPAERNFVRFAGFVSFFPHLVAGPLTRHHQLIPQLKRIATEGIRPQWRDGIYLFAVGLSKKVLFADRIANRIDPMIANLGQLGFVGSWMAVIGYAFQIYFDFSGYSDMAIGLGRLFGVELPQNFNSPYISLDPSEFWRRWHITLSLWLRDYLYVSLGGNRCSRLRKNVNLLITMVLGGLWHGAQWTFAIWGLFHGVLLVVHHALRPQWKAWPVVFQRALTFVLVCVGWVFFRARSFGEAVLWLHEMADGDGLHLSEARGQLPVCFALGVCFVIVWKTRNASSFEGLRNLGRRQQIALGVVTAAAIIFMNQSSRFLYFQF